MSESNQDSADKTEGKKGGKRLGAGRKPTGRVTGRVTITLPAILLSWLHAQKANPSQTIEKLLYYARGQDEK